MYTPEQEARFKQLHEAVVQADRKADEYATASHLQHPVIRKRVVMLVLGDTVRKYETEAPQDKRDEFGFDVKGLVEKVGKLL